MLQSQNKIQNEMEKNHFAQVFNLAFSSFLSFFVPFFRIYPFHLEFGNLQRKILCKNN